MQQSNGIHNAQLAVCGARRNGIDRLSLSGELDRSSVRLLERQLTLVVHVAGAVILDLRDLVSIDAWGLRLMERAARRARSGPWRLAMVAGQGAVRDAFVRAGIGHLLSGPELSDLLDAGAGEWSPVALSPLRRQVSVRRQAVLETL